MEPDYQAKPPVLPERVTAEERVKKQMPMGFGMAGDDSMAGYIFEQQLKQNWTKEQVDEVYLAHADLMEEKVPAAVAGLPLAAASGAADLTAFATTILYNSYNKALGHDWAWPEDMRNVPATSDWLGKHIGLSKEQTDSLAFIGGGLVLAPMRGLDNLDAKTVSKVLKTAKALGGGTRAGAIAKQSRAVELHGMGKDADAIWKETGWWPYERADGSTRWQFYISDADATVKQDRIFQKAAEQSKILGDTLKEGDKMQVSLRMDEVLDHPALFELYPEIGGYKINVWTTKNADGSWQVSKPVKGGGALASWDPGKRKFELNSAVDIKDMRESLLHEAQHAIQTLEGWQDGANITAMKSSVERYHLGKVFKDIYNKPEAFMDMDEVKWKQVFSQFGFDSGEADVLIREADRAIAGGLDATEEADRIQYWDNISTQAGDEASRWLATAVHMGDDKLQFIDDLPLDTVAKLASMRYYNDLGEIDSRLVEAFSRLTQTQIDDLPLNPHQFTLMLGRGKEGDVTRQLIPGAGTMSAPTDISNAIEETSEGVLGLPEEITKKYGWLMPDRTSSQVSEEELEVVKKALDNDPTLLARATEGLPEVKKAPSQEIGPSGKELITKENFSEDKLYNERTNYWRETGEDYETAARMASDDVEQIKANMKVTENFTLGTNRVTIKNTLHGSGGDIELEFLYNPSETGLRKWAAKSLAEDDGYKAVRVATDVQNNLYVWDANKALHNDFIKSTGIKLNIEDEWTDVDGVEPDDFGQIFSGSGVDLVQTPDYARPVPELVKEYTRLEDRVEDAIYNGKPLADQIDAEDELFDFVKEFPEVIEEMGDELPLSLKVEGNMEVLTLPDGSTIERKID